MKIAITGGSGFIGKNFLSLYKNKCHLIVLCRKQKLTYKDDFEYHSTDYSINSLNKILKGCDAVIHLASARPANKPDSISEYWNNPAITYNLLNACSKLGITNIIIASTILVYGSKNSGHIVESEIPLPDDIYGLSKYFCELIAQQFISYNQLRIKILRIGQVFGNYDNPNRTINHFINLARNKENIKIFSDGSLIRNYIYVKDVCRALDFALQKTQSKGIYHICTNELLTILDIAKIINAKFNNNDKIQFIKNNQQFTNAKFYDINKAFVELGWKPHWTFQTAIEDMINNMENI